MNVNLDRVLQWATEYRKRVGSDCRVEERRDIHAHSVGIDHEVGKTEMLLIVWESGETEATLTDGKQLQQLSLAFEDTESLTGHCEHITKLYEAIRASSR